MPSSPISYVQKAKTPTLIQHGENDRRVPIANAYELRQGLEDRCVKVEMVVYKGFGHGITKPRSVRAVAQHNLGSRCLKGKSPLRSSSATRRKPLRQGIPSPAE
jgi:dienelactone hydrolase